MQSVKDKYYYVYNWLVVTIGILLIAGSVAAETQQQFEFLGQYGFSLVTGVLGAVQAIYGLLLFKREALSSTPWLAGLFSSMLLTLSIIYIIHNTGQLHSWFLALWGFHVLVSGMFGLYSVISLSFIITLYFLLIATGEAGTKQFDLLAGGAVLGTYFIALVSYAIWRKFYVDHQTRQVQKLTGQLENKQQQADILIQSIADGLVVITVDGKISRINPAAAQMTGWDINEATGLDAELVLKITDEEGKNFDPENNPLKRIFKDSQPIKTTALLTSRNNKKIIVSIVISPVLSSGKKTLSGAVAVLRDISAARAEEKRRADFISTASHEMRTPVAAIEGYLALALNENVSKVDTKARGFLEKAHASTQHLGKLFQDLLTSARAEDGRLVNHPAVVEMGEYLEQLSDSLRFAAEKKGLLMDFVIGTEGAASDAQKVIKPLYYVYVDPDRIREVITNLFDNAVKYTDTGKVSIGLTGDSEIVQFYINDTGPGIPPDDIPHLFQKFYRVDNSSTRTIGGTGLGLFICRKIVELYHGRVWVESELGKGSTFYINLPRMSNTKAKELEASDLAKGQSIATPKS